MNTLVFTTGANIAIASFTPVINAKLVTYGIPCTMSYDAVTHLFTFNNSTDNGGLVIGGNILSTFSFDTGLAFYNLSSPKTTLCTLTNKKIADLLGNNGFYLTTNLGLGNHSFLAANNLQEQSVLTKIQLQTESTGIEFYSNLTSFKSRFYDTSISSLHTVLYDEDFLQWIPSSDWSCMLEVTFF